MMIDENMNHVLNLINAQLETVNKKLENEKIEICMTIEQVI
jgi:hypothetical protein